MKWLYEEYGNTLRSRNHISRLSSNSENEKLRDYDLLENELCLIYQCINNEEADGNTQNKKNVKPYILDCVTTVKELTMNINEKSDLEIKK
ncbi:hypothetical protein CWI37_0353p0010 [Hamiltosporidium tvaerminnensis]|uniref:Uncharacterized protein n=1 Tax=Hamiltosporidium tvaerminnensis TaxID=1176355 RepID=A0A4Q9L681_9MICR|nr:hypothetical protein CWI37_0353p0010 [Hamiltosporidium tvaerminnensis]